MEFGSSQADFAGMAALGRIPLVQESPSQPVWEQWDAEWRDLYILDRDGDFSEKINLTSFNPDPSFGGGANYAQLKSKFVTAHTTGVNNNPTAAAQSVSGTVNTPVAIALTGDDGDAFYTQALTFRVQTLPRNGTLADSQGNPVTVGSSLNGSNVRYTPNPSYNGPDSFTFDVRDDGGAPNDTSPPATVSVNITGVPPVTPPPVTPPPVTPPPVTPPPVTPPPVTPPPVTPPTTTGPQGTFVAELYRTVLRREADTPGLNNWVGHLQAGSSQRDIADAFWRSEEHRGMQVDEMYRNLLGREAEPQGRAHWINVLLRSGDEAAVIRNFLTSAEYTRSHPSNDAFVRGLYRDLFDRDASQVDVAFWGDQLGRRRQSRAAIVNSFLNSPEGRDTLLRASYQSVTGRAPTAQEMRDLTSQLGGALLNAQNLAVQLLSTMR